MERGRTLDDETKKRRFAAKKKPLRVIGWSAHVGVPVTAVQGVERRSGGNQRVIPTAYTRIACSALTLFLHRCGFRHGHDNFTPTAWVTFLPSARQERFFLIGFSFFLGAPCPRAQPQPSSPGKAASGLRSSPSSRT